MKPDLSRFGALLMAAALCGCAGTSAVVSTGTDTYKVSRRAANGFTRPGILVAEAERVAGEYCMKQNKRAVVASVQEAPPPFLFGNFPKAEVGFYCRDAGPPTAVSSTTLAAPQPVK